MTETDLLARGARSMGIDLSAAQLDRFRRFHLELVAWNRRVNLTSVAALEQVETRHFLDSLTVSLAVPSHVLHSGSMLDVGSGAGFPGVPLKIAFPGLRTTLMDSTSKRTAFLVHLIDALNLDGVEVRTKRAETMAHEPGLRAAFDLVVARAVARLPVLAELTLPFCKEGGMMVAQKSAEVDDEVHEARRAIEAMGGALDDVRAVGNPVDPNERRTLVVLKKVETTPERYPRRPGIPGKRPLVDGGPRETAGARGVAGPGA